MGHPRYICINCILGWWALKLREDRGDALAHRDRSSSWWSTAEKKVEQAHTGHISNLEAPSPNQLYTDLSLEMSHPAGKPEEKLEGPSEEKAKPDFSSAPRFLTQGDCSVCGNQLLLGSGLASASQHQLHGAQKAVWAAGEATCSCQDRLQVDGQGLVYLTR